MMMRLLLVDDQELLRTGLRTLAEHDGHINVVSEAEDGSTGLVAVRQHKPDVLLMEVRMPKMDGISAIQAIVADPSLTDTRVIVLTTFHEDENILAAIRATLAGYLFKDITSNDLRAAIRLVAARDALLSPTTTRRSWQRAQTIRQARKLSNLSPAANGRSWSGPVRGNQMTRSALASSAAPLPLVPMSDGF